MGVYENARKETKARIRNEFWNLYLKYSVDKITVKMITDACGLHRSTFYYHYKDVFEILEEIENDLYGKLLAINIDGADTYDGLNTIGIKLFEEFRNSSEFLHVLIIQQKEYTFSQKYRKLLSDKMNLIVYKTCQEDTVLQKKIVELTANSIIDLFLHLADTSEICYSDAARIMRGFMNKGYLPTMQTDFEISGMVVPDNNLPSF